MSWFARELGYGEEAAFWAQAGLLHDLDFERYPEEHCVKVREIMEARGLDPALIHAVVSHGWGMTEGDAQPEHEMERVLFAVDELHRTDRRSRPHAPLQERAGHGAEKPEEKI